MELRLSCTNPSICTSSGLSEFSEQPLSNVWNLNSHCRVGDLQKCHTWPNNFTVLLLYCSSVWRFYTNNQSRDFEGLKGIRRHSKTHDPPFEKSLPTHSTPFHVNYSVCHAKALATVHPLHCVDMTICHFYTYGYEDLMYLMFCVIDYACAHKTFKLGSIYDSNIARYYVAWQILMAYTHCPYWPLNI